MQGDQLSHVPYAFTPRVKSNPSSLQLFLSSALVTRKVVKGRDGRKSAACVCDVDVSIPGVMGRIMSDRENVQLGEMNA